MAEAEKERERAFPLAWVEGRMRVLPSESWAAAAAAVAANESKKEKTGCGRAGRDWETQEVKVREPEIREAE